MRSINYTVITIGTRRPRDSPRPLGLKTWRVAKCSPHDSRRRRRGEFMPLRSLGAALPQWLSRRAAPWEGAGRGLNSPLRLHCWVGPVNSLHLSPRGLRDTADRGPRRDNVGEL